MELGFRGVTRAESIALFGLPISEPMMETNADGAMVLTQWFERARFEYHGVCANGQKADFFPFGSVQEISLEAGQTLDVGEYRMNVICGGVFG